MSPAIKQHPEWMMSPIFPVSESILTPILLRIDRYRLRPGTGVPVHHLQQQIAIESARYPGGHPCLAGESLTGPPEVWRLTGFQSPAEQRRLMQAMEADPALRQALDRVESQLRVLVGDPSTLVASHCGGHGRRNAWPMGRGHYLVVTRVGSDEQMSGAVYQCSDGALYRFASARTRKSAELRAASYATESTILAVRPTWSVPAPAWIRCDPAFWNSSPVAKQSDVTYPIDRAR